MFIENLESMQEKVKNFIKNPEKNLSVLSVALIFLVGMYGFLQFEEFQAAEISKEARDENAQGSAPQISRGTMDFSDSLEDEREARTKETGERKRVVLSKNESIREARANTRENPRYSDFSKSLPGRALSDLPRLHPRLVSVCTCESSYTGTTQGQPRQFDPDGSIRKNLTGTKDIGMCQINEPIHGATAKRLGYDIYTKQGNIDFANWLHRKEGRAPWSASEHCWG